MVSDTIANWNSYCANSGYPEIDPNSEPIYDYLRNDPVTWYVHAGQNVLNEGDLNELLPQE